MRDSIRYGPYAIELDVRALSASWTLKRRSGHCIHKSVLCAEVLLDFLKERLQAEYPHCFTASGQWRLPPPRRLGQAFAALSLASWAVLPGRLAVCAASMKASKRGWGVATVLLYSGWNWAPTNHG